MTIEVICNDETVAFSSTSYQYTATAMVVDVTGECHIKATSDQKAWYPRFVISIYSSEIINMQEAVSTCEDATADDGSEWHLDVSSYYNCAKFATLCSELNCGGYDSYTGDGLTAS